MKIDVIHEQLACCITMNSLHTGIVSRAFLQVYSYCISCVSEGQTDRMLSIASAGIVIVSFACCYTNAALPPFSWDTLPVFYHSSNQSGDFSRDALETIAKFSMVTIEKWQAYEVKGVDDEDAMVIAMRDVKKINPNVATYFYMNSFKDRPEMTRMARQFDEHPEWALKDDQGNKVKNNQGYYVFDLSQPSVRNWWLETCLNATMSSSGDGCFCDVSTVQNGQGFKPPVSDAKLKLWNEGMLNLTMEVQKALGDSKLLIGKVPDQPYVKAVQIEFFGANNNSINGLMEGVKNGKVMQAHVPVGTDCTGDLTKYMAAFLIGAGKYSYFGCGEWQAIGKDSKPLTWREEYDKPLGEPEPPEYQNSMWSRRFSKGTLVTFDTATNKGEITWGK